MGGDSDERHDHFLVGASRWLAGLEDIMEIERIQARGQLLALILRQPLQAQGVTFVTEPENPLQLGVLGHKRGGRIKPHFHVPKATVIGEVQEMLHIEEGKVEAEFYSKDGGLLESAILNPGDIILLISGGHGFNILEDAQILEVKQGPYQGKEADKALLTEEGKP